MRRFTTSRRSISGLLARPPCQRAMYDEWTGLIVDRSAQLVALAELLSRGLLSRDEFERHKAKVLET